MVCGEAMAEWRCPNPLTYLLNPSPNSTPLINYEKRFDDLEGKFDTWVEKLDQLIDGNG